MERTQVKKAALHNLGCKVNSYETEVMEQQLREAGYQIVPFAPGADVYVINTCSVTNVADRKSRQMLHRAKKMNPGAVIVAAGCYVQTAVERTGLAVEADIILGNNQKKDLILALEEYEREQKNRRISRVIDINHTGEYEEMFLNRTGEHTRAYIKVQDGCNQFCSYCVIPYARGRARSRRPEEVTEELKQLAENGVKEVVLTGIHLSSYGTDLGTGLTDLILRVHEIEGIRRIRLGSLEPGIVTEEFAETLAGLEKFCPHFHLSLQSGCDTVLRRMNRRYTAREYEQRCGILRQYFSDPALTTDVIVGFPGETEEEFCETEEFLKKIRLYEAHIFKYSRREGTRAARMPDQIPEPEKNRRSDRLLALNRENKRAFLAKWAGRECQVLFEEKITHNGRLFSTGYTKEYIRVLFPGEQDLTNRILSGTLAVMPEEEDFLLFEPAKTGAENET